MNTNQKDETAAQTQSALFKVLAVAIRAKGSCDKLALLEISDVYDYLDDSADPARLCGDAESNSADTLVTPAPAQQAENDKH